jgi:hypothetical protein
MKKLLLGTAAAVLMCGAAYAEGSGLRALDLPGEPPGAGAMGPNQGDVVFPDGPINTPFNRGGYYGMYGYGAAPSPFGLFGPPMPAGPGYYGYAPGPGSYGYSSGPGYYGYAPGPGYYGRSSFQEPRPATRSSRRALRGGTDLRGERPGVQTSPTSGN